MSGDAHVRICESLGVQFPRATRLLPSDALERITIGRLCWRGRRLRPQLCNQPQNLLERLPRNGDLGHLEGDASKPVIEAADRAIVAEEFDALMEFYAADAPG
jgi:hypothetical protein